MENSVPALFQPIRIGPYLLQHRVVLAPLTRMRCTKDNVPQEVMGEYYSQRASTRGTLLVSEATLIAQKAGLYTHAPGIWNEAQIDGWKKVTKAVHAKGSFIFLQLWALGRTADIEALHAANPDYPFVSASDIPVPTGDERSKSSSSPKPRPLTQVEIKEYVELYATAAHNAVYKADFDGVEIHGANGYLIDQFLQDVCNHRIDEYGGSVENRCRFALEVTKAIVNAIGEERTGIRIGPWVPFQGMGMADPIPTFTYLVSQLKELYPGFAYLHVVEPGISGGAYVERPPLVSNDFIRDTWLPRPLITAGKYTRETAMEVAEKALTRAETVGLAKDSGGELIAFGKLFLANPDLPVRLRNGYPLNDYDKATFYIPGDTSGKGYTDYSFYV
ncbi:NADH:flavin oxidoreductase/NADH oxidase [Lentinula aff. detonsa]|uniref:NADH:flavin oxidoreductase/NADH oxidase n=1 Tax=Lentinula aff. detonsa TaxID=2804958 RepID=A0AA38L5N1_9AGAR|nr:NADH:flavin oxidoreductase/NADH oxidase [Lentinula aff. detonsa]